MTVISQRESVPPLIVSLDLGTSSARALVFDSLGRNINNLESRIPYRMNTTADGGVEIAADHLAEIVFRSLDELMAAISSAGEGGKKIESAIAGVAVSTFWHNLIGVDREGLAVTPLLNWNDTRSAATARKLATELDERRVHSRTGCVLHASYWPAKLAWLRDSHPDLFGKVSRWMSIGEYIYLRLFGRAVCSISMASATGLFNQNECDWDGEMLAFLRITPEQLSPLGDTDASLPGEAGGVRQRWPALAKARWYPALGDGACGNLGSGCVTRERAAINVGTSGALRVLWKAASVAIPPGLWCYRADGSRFVMGGALSNGGDLYAWMQQSLRLGTPEEVEAQLAVMEPDAHGLTVLPFLSGERSTGWAGSARAAINGMSLDTTPVEILRAGLEAIAYRFAAIYDLVVREVGEPEDIIASGAAVLRSSAWVQIISDVIGKPVIVSAETEASSRGAALLAIEALGAIPGIEHVETALGRVYYPDPQRHARYLEARARQERLYEALIGKPKGR